MGTGSRGAAPVWSQPARTTRSPAPGTGVWRTGASSDAQAVREAGALFFRMRAAAILTPGQAPVPLHIRNYDTLVDTDVRLRNRGTMLLGVGHQAGRADGALIIMLKAEAQ